MIFELDNTLISAEIFTQKFLCDLLACKGACCVEGDEGAPLEAEEVDILNKEYSNFSRFLSPEGRAVVEKSGVSTPDIDNEPVTPLLENGACAYSLTDENGILKCGIEQAYLHGETTFRKPVSCHLYPIRIQKTKTADAITYHRWDICKPACKNGRTEQISVAEFAKTALVRKYGEKWYEQLMEIKNEYY